MRKIKRFMAVLMTFVLCVSFYTPITAYGYNQSETQEDEVEALTNRLIAEGGRIPADFTLEEMNTFLEKGDPNTVKEIMDAVLSNAEPVAISESNAISSHIEQERSNEYTEYNFLTGEEKLLTMEEVDEQADSIEANNSISNLSISRISGSGWVTNPQAYPETRVIARLLIHIKGSNSQSFGTGFLIGPDTLLTASHVIYNVSDFGGMCDYIIVIPSCSESTNPYGTATTSTQTWYGPHYKTDSPSDDWGVIKLRKSFSIGALKLFKNNDVEKGRLIQVCGYPSRVTSSGKPSDYKGGGEYNHNLYTYESKVIFDFDATHKQISGAVYGGMSGGPVLYKDGSGAWVAGGIISKQAGNSNIICSIDYKLYSTIMSHV